MSARSPYVRNVGPLVLGCALLAAPPGASAEYFSLYLKCEGEVTSAAGKNPAHLDVAMRDNNQSAVIQRSNVLPVGEKMKYEVSPATYSMTYRSPKARTQPYYDWMRGQLFAWDPSLQRLAYIRLSIDRQNGNLEGDFPSANSKNSNNRRTRPISSAGKRTLRALQRTIRRSWRTSASCRRSSAATSNATARCS